MRLNLTQHGKRYQVRTTPGLTDCELFLDSSNGGAWPFLVGGVICLVDSDNERDLYLKIVAGLVTEKAKNKKQTNPFIFILEHKKGEMMRWCVQKKIMGVTLKRLSFVKDEGGRTAKKKKKSRQVCVRKKNGRYFLCCFLLYTKNNTTKNKLSSLLPPKGEREGRKDFGKEGEGPFCGKRVTFIRSSSVCFVFTASCCENERWRETGSNNREPATFCFRETKRVEGKLHFFRRKRKKIKGKKGKGRRSPTPQPTNQPPPFLTESVTLRLFAELHTFALKCAHV